MQGRMKTVICYFLSVFCCTACSLDIPYENQFSDPDAITTPHTARDCWHLLIIPCLFRILSWLYWAMILFRPI